MSKSLKRVIIIGLVLVTCDFSLYAWYGNLVKRGFEGMNPATADCAIVFFGGFTEDSAPNDETIRRCRHALNLFLKHRVSAPGRKIRGKIDAQVAFRTGNPTKGSSYRN